MPSSPILPVLRRLSSAFPDRPLDEQTLQVYLEELGDIPLPILEQAASRLIQTSAWFPRIAELRQVSMQLAGTLDIRSIFPPGVDDLGQQAMQLDNAFFHDGEFDTQKWEQLALKMVRLGRDYRAEELRRRSANIQAMLAEDQAISASTHETLSQSDLGLPAPAGELSKGTSAV